jgi:hypothetical protein
MMMIIIIQLIISHLFDSPKTSFKWIMTKLTNQIALAVKFTFDLRVEPNQYEKLHSTAFRSFIEVLASGEQPIRASTDRVHN